MNKEEQKARLQGSLLLFTQVFYKLRTGQEFRISKPMSREPHVITICKALTKTRRGETNRLLINIPPRYSKTELCIHYIAWCLAKYPNANFLYVSYSHTLAKRQTNIVRQIINMPEFKELFDARIDPSTSAKDNFDTIQGGSVYAAGAGGTITGRGAGIRNIEEFGGAIVLDDMHKPNEVTSDVMRDTIGDWYLNTLISRLNNPKRTPIVFICQRLHEDDLAARLLLGMDGHDWDRVVLKALGDNGQSLDPDMHSLEQLKQMQATMPYEFSAQYQQNPQPAGGGVFKPEWFQLYDQDPEIFATFITADTAETAKTYNDATVFSFWGVYKIKMDGIETNILGLHWLDCHECRVEPKDLKDEFMSFYRRCMGYPVKPQFAAIEKKSTGTTLVSTLKDMPGLSIQELSRGKDAITGGVLSKTDRFLRAQPFIARKQVSFNAFAPHVDDCIDHMRKITMNDTHRHDDIADTCADAIQLALIDKVVSMGYASESEPATDVVKKLTSANARRRNIRAKSRYGSRY
ncbi:MAG: hypothetical protein JSW00_04030 [Thermoplasmata archaeon]|nr:MAG: hypothetical protein JSW00_04030 [Thermoplasmata archaeon]